MSFLNDKIIPCCRTPPPSNPPKSEKVEDGSKSDGDSLLLVLPVHDALCMIFFRWAMTAKICDHIWSEKKKTHWMSFLKIAFMILDSLATLWATGSLLVWQ